MFEVEYKGANCVVISSKKASVVIDPSLSVVGLKDASVKDAIELATEARFALNSPDARLVIEGPGEYGVADFDITGIAAQRHLDTETDPKASTIYRIETGDIRTAVLGNIYEKLSEEQLEEIGIIDVLIIPVGGSGYTLDATGAATITRQIEPKLLSQYITKMQVLSTKFRNLTLKRLLASLVYKWKKQESLSLKLPLPCHQL